MRRVAQIRDAAFAEGDPVRRAVVELEGMRTLLMVPLLKEGQLIGAIDVHRREVRPFTDRQFGLLETFADQAVIAIENVRLFTETAEALERRDGHGRHPACDHEFADGHSARVRRSRPECRPAVRRALRRGVSVRRRTASILPPTTICGGSPRGGSTRVPYDDPIGALSGRAILDGAVVHVPDIEEDPEIWSAHHKTAPRSRLSERSLACPCSGKALPIGTIAVLRQHAERFSDKQVALLRTFANQAVIAIENVRLFKELEGRNRDLAESLEQQTATAEILRVIASSPTDLQPVLEAVVENAARVCGATNSSIFGLEGEHLRLVVRHGSLRRTAMAIGDTVPVVPGSSCTSGNITIQMFSGFSGSMGRARERDPADVAGSRRGGAPAGARSSGAGNGD